MDRGGGDGGEGARCDDGKWTRNGVITGRRVERLPNVVAAALKTVWSSHESHADGADVTTSLLAVAICLSLELKVLGVGIHFLFGWKFGNKFLDFLFCFFFEKIDLFFKKNNFETKINFCSRTFLKKINFCFESNFSKNRKKTRNQKSVEKQFPNPYTKKKNVD